MSFLVPLWLGFAFVGASAFTAAYSRLLGEMAGQRVSVVLRNFMGIPLFLTGFIMAWVLPSRFLFAPTIAALSAGGFLIVAGAVPFFWGHFIIGRPSHMPSVKDALVRRSLYASVRHPIYAGGLAICAGGALVHPTSAFVAATASGFIWLLIQARLEEIDLLQRMPQYRDYMREVPNRFLPRIGGRRPG